MTFRFPKTPLYIPKVQDTTILGWGVKLVALCVNAQSLVWRPSLKAVKGVADIFIVDPVTDRILSKDATAKKSWSKLQYPDVEPEQLYSAAAVRRTLIVQAIKNQIDVGAGVLIAPYLFAEDTDDTKFSINLTLLAETIKYKQELGIESPLFAMICIGNSVLARPAILNQIIDRYTDDFAGHVDGFVLSVGEFNGRKTTDGDQFTGLAHLVFRLAEHKPVIVKRVDAFGEILCALGASGFSSGLSTSETYSLKKEKEEDPKRKALRRIYAPEIFDYLNDEEAKKVGYDCHPSSGSTGIHPETTAVKQRHYLEHKLERVTKMQGLSQEKRIEFMLREIEAARRTAAQWVSKYGIPPKFQHASRWKAVLEEARHWKPSKENDEELARLLAELEKDD